MEKSFYNIFKTFFKVGTLLLGGGYVILPLLQEELCVKRDWVDFDELCEYYALGQSVPGIIAANTSIFVGCKLCGTKGAIAAAAGMITPAFISIVLLAKILEQLVAYHFVQSLFWGVGIGVIMLLFLAVKEMWGKSIVDNFTCVVFFVAFFLSAGFKVSPAYLIIAAIIFGIIYEKYRQIKAARRAEDGVEK